MKIARKKASIPRNLGFITSGKATKRMFRKPALQTSLPFRAKRAERK
ncbi:MAG: hypothetical protein Q3X03_05270 [Eggerthellaceae bacterium]|nr:hypothetical protein [Eggerthellaceae bacterium]